MNTLAEFDVIEPLRAVVTKQCGGLLRCSCCKRQFFDTDDCSCRGCAWGSINFTCAECRITCGCIAHALVCVTLMVVPRGRAQCVLPVGNMCYDALMQRQRADTVHTARGGAVVVVLDNASQHQIRDRTAQTANAVCVRSVPTTAPSVSASLVVTSVTPLTTCGTNER